MVHAAAAILLVVPLAALGAGFPPYASLPPLPIANAAVETESYGQIEFVGRGKTEVQRGRIWLGYLDYAAQWGEDRRNALSGIVSEMEKGGWQVMLRDEPRNPPLATLRLERGRIESWASVEVFDLARVAILQVGPPRVKLKLEAPRAGASRAGERSDFAFARRFPGARLARTAREARPLVVETGGGKAPLAVGKATVVKEYQAPSGTGRLEIATAYRDAMKAAGWEVIREEFDAGKADPAFTARYARDGVELWAQVRAAGERYTITVAETSRAAH